MNNDENIELQLSENHIMVQLRLKLILKIIPITSTILWMMVTVINHF